MDSIIPLHALVVVLSPAFAHPPELEDFPKHEITSPAIIARELWGGGQRPELDNIITEELRRRLILKLSLGERMVLLAHTLDPDDCRYLSRIARAQGAQVIYLLPEYCNLGNRVPGDGYAHTVLRLSRDKFHVATGLGVDHAVTLASRFRGITVAGDVHGNLEGLTAVAAWARSRNHFLFLLGDVLDYGPDSLATIELAHRLVMSGKAGLIIGNHERKIGRWFQQQVEGGNRAVKLSEGNRVTTDALNRLSADKRGRWFGRFRSLLARASLIEHLGPVTLAHAAIHGDVWRDAGQQNHGDIEHYALYGEAELIREGVGPRQYRSRYTWVDQVPEGKLVMVGHDQRSLVPLAVRGASGGNVVFLDTGSGKGGALSSADLRFTAGGSLRLENFNRHDG